MITTIILEGVSKSWAEGERWAFTAFDMAESKSFGGLFRSKSWDLRSRLSEAHYYSSMLSRSWSGGLL